MTNNGQRLNGKVAFVTGAARGQGRSHALTLAGEGADLILLDSVCPIEHVDYAMPTSADLKETARLVEERGRKAVLIEADVRDEAMIPAVADAANALGRLDIVVANAGVLGAAKPSWELTRAEWDTLIDINLTGVWQTFKAALPHIISGGRGGSIIAISSIAGIRGVPHVAHYTAAKHALVGLVGSIANEVASHNIRANTVHPTNVRTDMIDNPTAARIFRPDLEHPNLDDGVEVLGRINLLPVPWVDSTDISEAVLWLASDESRYVTGTALPVDAGMLAKYPG
ncbi:mycofactocin-coupled SDR family oxidoreductase [Rhodococcus sp. HM1]|uniref:mycofactocin-coupled SDR family oxidoreductase n=1 Tax=Rhodococcus sp. HM1 TaxID=2937759 RepID=UPI00200A317F|nr:mycofactocin-coupled SDR family oxidoreductase [Rhodococcus sp. HM1]MCK8674802.1 mycofactocin-coupled SDR family oxidoreductase [Rhodococcus sp. HM1]